MLCLFIKFCCCCVCIDSFLFIMVLQISFYLFYILYWRKGTTLTNHGKFFNTILSIWDFLGIKSNNLNFEIWPFLSIHPSTQRRLLVRSSTWTHCRRCPLCPTNRRGFSMPSCRGRVFSSRVALGRESLSCFGTSSVPSHRIRPLPLPARGWQLATSEGQRCISLQVCS